MTLTELSLLVLVGLTSGMYAKSEKANSFWAAVVGVGVAILIYLVTR